VSGGDVVQRVDELGVVFDEEEHLKTALPVTSESLEMTQQ